MRSLVPLNGRPVYCLSIVDTDTVRLRVMTGEWDTIRLEPGAVVSVGLPGGVRKLLLSGVTPLVDIGTTWLEFVPTIQPDRPAGRRG